MMNKKTILLPFLFVFQIVIAQEISFKNGQFQNGLTYPIASLRGNPEAETKINQTILNIVSVYESQDYCIGQFGYVQKTSFIQLNFYFNCIDMDESKTEYHFFNLVSGELCPVSDMFLAKEKKRYEPFFRDRISQYIKENGKEAPSNEFIEAIDIDDCDVKLVAEGIEVSMSNYDNWPDEALTIPWADLRPFLKTTFL